jgi:hypothetical protein
VKDSNVVKDGRSASDSMPNFAASPRGDHFGGDVMISM